MPQILEHIWQMKAPQIVLWGLFLFQRHPHGEGNRGRVLVTVRVYSSGATAVLALGRWFLGGADEHSRFSRADSNAPQPLCHALLPSMALTSVVELRDPFLLGWGVGRVLRS